MKTIAVIIKTLKEQIRSYWVLLLSLSMGPFFIFIYFLMTETSKTQYNLLIVNHDTGVMVDSEQKNYGNELISTFEQSKLSLTTAPFIIKQETNREKGIYAIKNNKADALIIIEKSFSQTLEKRRQNDLQAIPEIEFLGDLTSTNYLISAVWANELIHEYAYSSTQSQRTVEVKETALGQSASLNDFNILVPGILIVSLIMLMFTASISFVSEIENKTIIRLKLSKISTFDFLFGISIVQLLVGLTSVILTLFTAIFLGFQYSGSLAIMIFIAGLTSLSIIAFSLIIAAITKSANEVLVVGNFPMFLFMFFSGAAFPLKSSTLFTISDYPISIQGLMTPTHAISALKKTLVLDMSFSSIIPEIISIIVLTILYFLVGGIIFKRRHLNLT